MYLMVKYSTEKGESADYDYFHPLNRDFTCCSLQSECKVNFQEILQDLIHW